MVAVVSPASSQPAVRPDEIALTTTHIRASTTTYNVTISVLALFLLLVKAILFVTGLFPPLAGLLLHALLTGLFAYSVHAQTAPDLSDHRRPQRGAPWYLTHRCGVVRDGGLVGYCMQAKAAFGVTVVLL